MQRKAEFDKVVEMAAALAKAKVRLVSIDFSDGKLPSLLAIHQAGGGLPADFVKTLGDSVIGRLHALGMTQLPGVVKQDVLKFPASSTSFEATYAVKVDPLATRSVVTWQFQPAVSDFEKTLKMKVRIGSRDVDLNAANDDEQFTVALDGKGNLATISAMLDEGQKLSEVALLLSSPDQSRVSTTRCCRLSPKPGRHLS